jgi:hypothetical protein
MHAAVTVPKLALLLLYLRIFAGRKIRIATWIVIGVVIAHFLVINILFWVTLCQPFAYKWDKSIPGGHCVDYTAAYRYVSIPNLVTDLALLVLPISTLWKLKMGKSRKVGILMTFLAGGLGVSNERPWCAFNSESQRNREIITAIIRFVAFIRLDPASDPTFLSVNTMIYSIIETAAYFICSCLPGIRPLVRAIYQG